MPREKEGSSGTRKDKPGLWARVSYKDETGRRRVIQRKVASRTEGKALIKKLPRQIEDDGARVIDGERMTFNKLAEDYTDHKLQPPVYKGETSKVYSIPYNQFIVIEYGQKAGRRVGAAIATAVLLCPWLL